MPVVDLMDFKMKIMQKAAYSVPHCTELLSDFMM